MSEKEALEGKFYILLLTLPGGGLR